MNCAILKPYKFGITKGGHCKVNWILLKRNFDLRYC